MKEINNGPRITSSVFHEENEDVVEEFLDGHPEFQLDRIDKILPEKFHLFVQNRYFKTFPPRDEMDGFFVARMIKGNRQMANNKISNPSL